MDFNFHGPSKWHYSVLGLFQRKKENNHGNHLPLADK